MNSHKESENQLKAISHVSGPARVLAGPGSGKTFTIIQRILFLITQKQVSPQDILTVTFTKAAAGEMQQRFEKEAGQHPAFMHQTDTVQFGTIHSICYNILKESNISYHYSLIKESEKRKILEILLQNNNLAEPVDYDTLSYFLDAVSKKKNGIMPINLPLAEEQFDLLFSEYQNMLRQLKLLDFDDMIMECMRILKESKNLCRKWQNRFRYILVDEFQDINAVQYQVLKLLAAPENNLFVVGDDDQSIYGFRGAAPFIMKQFLEDFPKAKQYLLSENYRSGAAIISLAEKVISPSTERISKNILPIKTGGKVSVCFRETRKEEEKQLVDDLKKLSEEYMKQSAVIVRTNIEVYHYTALLKQHGITIREKKVDENHVLQHFIREDFQAFLQFCHEGNRRTDFIKIMNKPNLYLSRQALMDTQITKNGILLYYKNNEKMKAKVEKLFEHFKTASGLSASLAIRYFRNIIGYDDYLKQKAGNKDILSRWLAVADKLQELFKQKDQNESCSRFLLRMQEMQEESKRPKEEKKLLPGISVITMHGAKGLEFQNVFLPDVNEGVIPYKGCKTSDDREEERRLLYVAITRAKESLNLYYTRERNRKLSSFLEGIIPPHQ